MAIGGELRAIVDGWKNERMRVVNENRRERENGRMNGGWMETPLEREFRVITSGKGC